MVSVVGPLGAIHIGRLGIQKVAPVGAVPAQEGIRGRTTIEEFRKDQPLMGYLMIEERMQPFSEG